MARAAARDGGAQEVTELLGGGPRAHHRPPPLGRRFETDGAADQHAAAGDERGRGEEEGADPAGRAHRSEQCHAHSEAEGQANEQDLRPAVHHPPEHDVAGDIRCGAGGEQDAGDERGRAVGLGEERAGKDQRSHPGRGRQQLGQGPESGRPVTKSRRQALRVRARRRCRPHRDCDACDDGSGEGKRQPRPPPAELADRSDQRHADDPGGRRSDQRPRERPGALLLRNPLGSGDRSADQEAGDGEPEEKLGDQEDGERRRGGAQSRCGRQPECPGGDHATQWNPAGEGAECDRRQPRGQAGRRAQLACSGRRDVQIRGHLRQHGCQRDHARLSREQAEEERDPDRSLGPSPPIRRCRTAPILRGSCPHDGRSGMGQARVSWCGQPHH